MRLKCTITQPETFWCRVDRSGGPDACWPFLMRCDYGYGRVLVDEKMMLAHRAAYAVEHGPFPRGLCVLHTCDNPSCCNPRHLFLGTHADNMRDRDEKGRAAHGTRNGSAKLDDDTVRAARARHTAGVPGRALAREYGVSETTMRQLLARDTWRHVE